ncbi:electron transfer flavoprotein beta-subunit [mine drainage metagenome]|uniref:Electron transfer flavoprotein beta-subunit n=1 Tax=mine drainage metagenome TaxID=410659 RepID=T1C1I1_9ZZZZ
MTLADLGMPPEWVGLRGSPTVVKSMRTIDEKKREGKKFTLEEIPKLVDELIEKKIINL